MQISYVKKCLRQLKTETICNIIRNGQSISSALYILHQKSASKEKLALVLRRPHCEDRF